MIWNVMLREKGEPQEKPLSSGHVHHKDHSSTELPEPPLPLVNIVYASFLEIQLL